MSKTWPELRIGGNRKLCEVATTMVAKDGDDDDE